jgi:hypothetical protein
MAFRDYRPGVDRITVGVGPGIPIPTVPIIGPGEPAPPQTTAEQQAVTDRFNRNIAALRAWAGSGREGPRPRSVQLPTTPSGNMSLLTPGGLPGTGQWQGPTVTSGGDIGAGNIGTGTGAGAGTNAGAGTGLNAGGGLNTGAGTSTGTGVSNGPNNTGTGIGNGPNNTGTGIGNGPNDTGTGPYLPNGPNNPGSGWKNPNIRGGPKKPEAPPNNPWAPPRGGGGGGGY